VLPLTASQYATASFSSTEGQASLLPPRLRWVSFRSGSAIYRFPTSCISPQLPSGSMCPASPANGRLCACNVAGNPPAEKPAFLLDSRILRPQSPPLERVRLCPSSLHFAAVLGTFKSVDAASLGAGLRLGWLNAITADLSVAQVAQGQGLLGTGAVPELLQTGPRKNTRFFFILTARL
jgi:hypothetical protein